jgi:hypothetical protein
VTSAKTYVISIVAIGGLAAATMSGYLAGRSGSTKALAPGREAAPGQAVSAPEAATAQPAVAAALSDTSANLSPVQTSAPARRAVGSSAPGRRSVAPDSRLPNGAAPARPAAALEVPRSNPEPAAIPTEGPAPVAEGPAISPAPEPPPVPRRELTVPEDSVIGIRLDTTVSSETAAVEDRVTARITRDVKADDVTVIAAGAVLEGSVTMVERGGKFRDRARIGIRFHTLVSGAERQPIETETIFRDGDAPTREATTKIGASAMVGTILGAVIGGKKGAAIGGTAGAAGGTAAVMAGDRNEATIAAGTPLTVRLTAPVVVTVLGN